MINPGLHPYSLNNAGVQLSPIPSISNSIHVPAEDVSPLFLHNRVSNGNATDNRIGNTQFGLLLPQQKRQLNAGSESGGIVKGVISSMTNPLSNSEIDHVYQPSNFSSQQQWKDNLQLSNNISTIKVKTFSNSQLSNISGTQAPTSFLPQTTTGVTILSPHIRGDGVRDGMENRQKMFKLNGQDEQVQYQKPGTEDPQEPDLSEQMRSSFLSNNLNNDLPLTFQLIALPQTSQQIVVGGGNGTVGSQVNGNNNAINGWRKDSVNERTYKTATITYSTYKKQKQLWFSKWMVMSLYISNSIRRFKKTLLLSKPTYLTKLQMNLINDKSAHYDVLRENKEKRYQGWLYNDHGMCSRKTKKSILILLKRVKPVKQAMLTMLKAFKRQINIFDKEYPPLSPLLGVLNIIDSLVFCVTVLTALFIPLVLCFREELRESSFGKSAIDFIHIIAPWVFVFDTLKYLNTSCFVRGQIISDRIQILKNYCRDRLVCDVLSILALLLYSNPVSAELLLFYTRLTFGVQVVGKLRESFLLHSRVHASINLFILVTFLYFFAHIFACLWYFIGVQESFYSPNSWITMSNISNASIGEKYIHSLHFALSMLSQIDSSILPTTFSEKIFIILINTCSLLLLGYVFHEASQIFEAISLNRRNYLNQLTHIKRYMSDHNVGEHYYSLARKYLQYVSSEGLDSRQVSAEKSLQGLSKQLKEDIIQNSFLNQLKSIRVFSRFFSEQFLAKLASKMGEQILGPDEHVINLNKLQQPRIFIVKKGLIEFCVKIGTQRTDKLDSLKSFRVFRKDEYFGSFEFFSDTYKPHLSARSVGVSVIQYISLRDFLDLLEEFPEEREAYIFVKEMVTIYSKLDTIGVSCYSCGEKDHQTLSCPYLFYDKQRSSILKHIDQHQYNQVRSYQRKEQPRFNCRMSCQKIYHAQDRFVIDNAEWLQSRSSMISLEVEDNLQLNNIDLPKPDSQYLDSYFHIRGKASSIGTFGTLRVRDEKAPGDINGIYFDSELDAYSVNSAYLKSNVTKTMNEYEWNQQVNQSQGSINNIQPGTNSGNNMLQPKVPSINNAFEDEDQGAYLRKLHSKLTSSPSRNSVMAPSKLLPELKYRSKSQSIRATISEGLLDDPNSLIDIKSMGAKSPRPNTIIPSSKSDLLPSLMRRNTTKTRNRVQSFSLDTNSLRENQGQRREPQQHRSQRKPYEQSLFSQTKLERTANNIYEEEEQEESSQTDEREQEEIEVGGGGNSQYSHSHPDNARSDKQSKKSEKQIEELQDENISSYAYFANNFSSVHSFRTFFPHNNIENVILFINKKGRDWRRARSKKFTKGITLRGKKRNQLQEDD